MASYAARLYENVPIVAQGFCTSKKKETPGFYLVIKPGEYERTITWWLPDGDEAAIDRLFAGLETLGYAGESFAQLESTTPGFFDFSQLQISCECKHQNATDGSGKVYEQWQLPFANTNEVTPLDADQIRRLDTLFGRSMKDRFGKKPAMPGPAGPVPKAKPSGPSVPEMHNDFDKGMAQEAEELHVNDESIPF